MYEVGYEEGALWRKIQVALLLYAAGGMGVSNWGVKYTIFKRQAALYPAAAKSQVSVYENVEALVRE